MIGSKKVGPTLETHQFYSDGDDGLPAGTLIGSIGRKEGGLVIGLRPGSSLTLVNSPDGAGGVVLVIDAEGNIYTTGLVTAGGFQITQGGAITPGKSAAGVSPVNASGGLVV